MTIDSNLSFNTSIMGTQAVSQKLNAISSSIAAAETTAGRQFEVLISECNSTATNVFTLGSTEINHIDVIGTPINTSVPTNFTILGAGFTINKDSRTGQVGYCRDCTYQMNQYNQLENSSGQLLQVFKVDASGNLPTGVDTSNFNALTTLDLSDISVSARPTTAITAQIKFPAVKAKPSYESTLNIIDPLGVQQTLGALWMPSTQAPVNAGNSVWSIAVIDPKNLTASINSPYQNSTTTTETPDGQTITTSQGGSVFAEFDGNGNLVGFFINDSSSNSNGGMPSTPTLSSTPPNLQINWNDQSAASNIVMNFGTVGKNDGLSVGGDQLMMTNIDSDGYIAGAFSSFEFDEEGYGIVHCTNKQDLIYCKVPLANFAATNQLSQQKGGVYLESYTSGTPKISFPGTNGVGLLQPNSRESSNVNVTNLYLAMIRSQSNYVGNLKAIETTKELTNRLMQV